jgi:hypothetical protein
MITVGFSEETLKARRAWNDVFQALTQNNPKKSKDKDLIR